jgi:hypothetical protein
MRYGTDLGSVPCMEMAGRARQDDYGVHSENLCLCEARSNPGKRVHGRRYG